MGGKEKFSFVFIPCDASEPIEQWSQKLSKGQEVECLIDRLKEHYMRTAQPDARAKQRQREALLSHLPQDVQEKLDEKYLEQAASIMMVETVSLLSHTPENGYVAVSMYIDDKSTLKGLPLNERASGICACCGHPAEG